MPIEPWEIADSYFDPIFGPVDSGYDVLKEFWDVAEELIIDGRDRPNFYTAKVQQQELFGGKATQFIAALQKNLKEVKDLRKSEITARKSFDPSADPSSTKLGFTTLSVPPQSIRIDEHHFTEEVPGLRTNGTSVVKTGRGQLRITLNLTFPTVEDINSELREIIAQFKASPFLPLWNSYISAVVNAYSSGEDLKDPNDTFQNAQRIYRQYREFLDILLSDLYQLRDSIGPGYKLKRFEGGPATYSVAKDGYIYIQWGNGSALTKCRLLGITELTSAAADRLNAVIPVGTPLVMNGFTDADSGSSPSAFHKDKNGGYTVQAEYNIGGGSVDIAGMLILEGYAIDEGTNGEEGPVWPYWAEAVKSINLAKNDSNVSATNLGIMRDRIRQFTEALNAIGKSGALELERLSTRFGSIVTNMNKALEKIADYTRAISDLQRYHQWFAYKSPNAMRVPVALHQLYFTQIGPEAIKADLVLLLFNHSIFSKGFEFKGTFGEPVTDAEDCPILWEHLKENFLGQDAPSTLADPQFLSQPARLGTVGKQPGVLAFRYPTPVTIPVTEDSEEDSKLNAMRNISFKNNTTVLPTRVRTPVIFKGGVAHQNIYEDFIIEANNPNIIVKGVALSIENRMVPLAVQSSLFPAYQYLGSFGSKITIQLEIDGNGNREIHDDFLRKIHFIKNNSELVSLTGDRIRRYNKLYISHELLSLAGIRSAIITDVSTETVGPFHSKITLQLSEYTVSQEQREELKSPFPRSKKMMEEVIAYFVDRAHNSIRVGHAHLGRARAAAEQIQSRNRPTIHTTTGDPQASGQNLEDSSWKTFKQTYLDLLKNNPDRWVTDHLYGSVWSQQGTLSDPESNKKEQAIRDKYSEIAKLTSATGRPPKGAIYDKYRLSDKYNDYLGVLSDALFNTDFIKAVIIYDPTWLDLDPNQSSSETNFAITRRNALAIAKRLRANWANRGEDVPVSSWGIRTLSAKPSRAFIRTALNMLEYGKLLDSYFEASRAIDTPAGTRVPEAKEIATSFILTLKTLESAAESIDADFIRLKQSLVDFVVDNPAYPDLLLPRYEQALRPVFNALRQVGYTITGDLNKLPSDIKKILRLFIPTYGDLGVRPPVGLKADALGRGIRDYVDPDFFWYHDRIKDNILEEIMLPVADEIKSDAESKPTNIRGFGRQNRPYPGGRNQFDKNSKDNRSPARGNPHLRLINSNLKSAPGVSNVEVFGPNNSRKSVVFKSLAPNTVKDNVKEWSNRTSPNFDPESASAIEGVFRHVLDTMPDNTFRMIRAFPAFALYLIEEDAEEYGFLDDFFGYTAISEIHVTRHKYYPDVAEIALINTTGSLNEAKTEIEREAAGFNRTPLAVRGDKYLSLLRWMERMEKDGKHGLPALATGPISNFVQKLQKMYSGQANPAPYRTFRPGQNRAETEEFTGEPKYPESFYLKAGTMIQVRMGYSSKIEDLETVFNGQIVELMLGDLTQIVAQGYKAELTTKPNFYLDGGDMQPWTILDTTLKQCATHHFGIKWSLSLNNTFSNNPNIHGKFTGSWVENYSYFWNTGGKNRQFTTQYDPYTYRNASEADIQAMIDREMARPTTASGIKGATSLVKDVWSEDWWTQFEATQKMMNVHEHVDNEWQIFDGKEWTSNLQTGLEIIAELGRHHPGIVWDVRPLDQGATLVWGKPHEPYWFTNRKRDQEILYIRNKPLVRHKVFLNVQKLMTAFGGSDYFTSMQNTAAWNGLFSDRYRLETGEVSNDPLVDDLKKQFGTKLKDVTRQFDQIEKIIGRESFRQALLIYLSNLANPMLVHVPDEDLVPKLPKLGDFKFAGNPFRAIEPELPLTISSAEPGNESRVFREDYEKLKDLTIKAGSNTTYSLLMNITAWRSTLRDTCKTFNGTEMSRIKLISHIFGLPPLNSFSQFMDSKYAWENWGQEYELEESVGGKSSGMMLDNGKMIDVFEWHDVAKFVVQNLGKINAFIEYFYNFLSEALSNDKAEVVDRYIANAANASADAAPYEMNPRQKPFRNYHYATSALHILDNKIRTSIDEMATSVRVKWQPGWGDNINMSTYDAQGASTQSVHYIVPSWGFYEIEYHKDIRKSANAKMVTVEEPHCETEFQVERAAISNLARFMRNMYRGEILLIGNERIAPYDIIQVDDIFNDLHGPIEAEAVFHHLSFETGFVTGIQPHLVVAPNAFSDAMGASTWGGITAKFKAWGAFAASIAGTIGAGLLHPIIGGSISPTLVHTGLNAWFQSDALDEAYGAQGIGMLWGEGKTTYNKNHPITILPMTHANIPWTAGLNGIDSTDWKVKSGKRLYNLKQALGLLRSYTARRDQSYPVYDTGQMGGT